MKVSDATMRIKYIQLAFAFLLFVAWCAFGVWWNFLSVDGVLYYMIAMAVYWGKCELDLLWKRIEDLEERR